eukprot:jgi/Picre1/27059/NNA_000029.t1
MLKSWWLYLGVSAGCLGATSAALGKCAGLYFEDRWGLRIFLYILMVLANGGMLFSLLGIYAPHIVTASHRSVCRIQHHYEGSVDGASGACTPQRGLRQKYVFEVAYDGTDFCGFQLQPSVPTVQATLERSLCRFLHGMHRDHLVVQGAARTDSGVHARQQERFQCEVWHVPKNPAELDIDAMREGCQSFVLRDFGCLRIRLIVLSKAQSDSYINEARGYSRGIRGGSHG